MPEHLWSATVSFLRRLKYLPPLLAASVFAVAYWESSAPEREREKSRKEKETIGLNASIAGNLLASAYKSCSRIGIPNVVQCAKWKGPLIDDVLASAIARVAVDKRAGFDDLCQRHHDVAYCYELLNRAFQLGLNSPAEGSN